MLPSRIFFDSMLDDFKIDDRMKCDIYEKDNMYHVEVDVPGFNKNDINIEINKGTLSIIAEKKGEEKEENEKKYLRRERSSYGKYQRSFYLGDVDEENVEATFKNGILKIEIPKKTESECKKTIEIK